MPSLRKRVSSYFRQLSFYNDPREKKHNINENSFINKYLEGQIAVKDGPPILYGKSAADLPNYELGIYNVGSDSIIGCYSGPNGGLTAVKRLEKHLSVPDTDIDFIDTPDDIEVPVKSPVLEKSPLLTNKVDNMTMLIKVAGQEYLVTNRKKTDTKSHSLGSLSDFDVGIEKTKIFVDNNNSDDVKCKNLEVVNSQNGDQNATNERKVQSRESLSKKDMQGKRGSGLRCKSKSPETSNYNLSKSKSEGNPFHHKKRGKIIRISSRPTAHGDTIATNTDASPNLDLNLPETWSRKSDNVCGISDSLYDKNQVTKHRNGDPIADCFGVIARNDSAILALADGVNWGERASIAAKSAIHGCLHYLNKTVFNDTKPFDDLTTKSDLSIQKTEPILNHNRICNTRDVFVCLLRAFNCAHDLILENEGMLTTLTVAIVLPLKPKNIRASTSREKGDSLSRRTPQSIRRTDDNSDSYVCCVCNVGDTLAYVYSQKYGVRELTKGSHDINCNRDMRDALGALGPVDGINPELSNLTLSITTVQKGDIIMVASDGLTDNFDPNVCKFTVNSKDSFKSKRSEVSEKPSSSRDIPIKPPRRSRERSDETEEKPASSEAKKTEEPKEDYDNPLVAQFMRENSHDDKSNLEKLKQSAPTVSAASKKSSSQTVNNMQNQCKVYAHKTTNRNIELQSKQNIHNKTGFLRSKTSLDMRTSARTIFRNDDGIPFVTPLQRYEISLLLMEDILKRGISGSDFQCTTAKKVCENLVNFAFSISAAKRHTLEDADLYFDNVNGVLVEVSQHEKKARRRKGLDRVQTLPGKLDHVSIVAYNVGNFVCTY